MYEKGSVQEITYQSVWLQLNKRSLSREIKKGQNFFKKIEDN